MKDVTGLSRWNTLNNLRASFIGDCEQFAKFTIPTVCSDQPQLSRAAKSSRHDFQSVGAQSVNHLTNKLILALFAPSRPFMRIDVPDEAKAEILRTGITEPQLDEQFAVAERRLVKRLDQLRSRPKLYEAIRHLIITGNVLLMLRKGRPIRVMGIKRYCVSRDIEGDANEIVICEEVTPDELDTKTRAALAGQYNDETKVKYVKWLKRDDAGWKLTHWVNDTHLVALDSQYNEDDMPYVPLVWNLSDEDNYGTGLVEDYSGDFFALSMLAEAEVKAAILASEFRWLVNPAGMTTPEDFEQSDNGSALPGAEGDITPLVSNNAQSLQVIANTNSTYINRIGRAFLLGSAVTRDAERVTAEEIRMQAMELETSLGGVYSRLAIEFQLPLAQFLLRDTGIEIKGTELDVVIITGLDALSRQADRDNLMAFLQDITVLGAIPPQVSARLRADAITSDLAGARGLLSSRYVASEQEYQAAMQAQQAQAAAAAGAQAGAVAQAEAAAQPQGE